MTKAEAQPITASQLDKVFDIALVLLGVLAAAELQYATTLQLSSAGMLFYFRVTTIPFIVLILVWIAKEIGLRVVRRLRLTMLATLFCWSLWSNSLLVFMFLFYSLSEPFQTPDIYNIVLWSLLGVSLLIGAMVDWAYHKRQWFFAFQ